MNDNVLPHPSQLDIPGPSTPAELFEGTLPRALAAMVAPARGTLTVEVVGDAGGTWTVDLADRRVFGGAVAEPDAALRIASGPFAEMLTGSLDIDGALNAGTLEVHGDIDVIARLAAVLEGLGKVR